VRAHEEEMKFLRGEASTDILDSGNLIRNESFELSDDGNYVSNPLNPS